MSTNLGKVVIVDIEMTCWDPSSQPDDERPELIEVGVCLLTTPSLDISRPRRIFVKPKAPVLSQFCVNLTGITMDLLNEKGIHKDDAWRILRQEYKLGDRVWAGWGDDGSVLRRELETTTFSESYINLCSLFSIAAGLNKRVGLHDAMAMVGLTPVGQRHAGGDDAYNAAQVLRWIISSMRGSIGQALKHDQGGDQ